jgi:hypothetical protein
VPTIALPPGDYWHLRFLQERIEHAKTRGLLGELRATQAHADLWSTLTTQHPAIATADAWALTDATTSLSAPDAPPKAQP